MVCRGLEPAPRPYGRCLCHSPDHPRDAVNEGHHPITLVVITDPANGISAAPAGVNTVVQRSYPCHDMWRAAARLPQQPRSRSGAWHTVPHPGHGGAECARANHRVDQACMRYLRVDGYVARNSCLRTSSHGQHLPAMAMMPARRLEARATGSACSLPDAA